MAGKLHLPTITEKYRILGLAFSASKDDVRRARNKLIMQFHPDRHPTGWQQDDTSLEDRLNLVITAYEYIINNYDEINAFLGFLPDSCLTNKFSRTTKSHWIYSEVESYHDKNSD